MADPEIQQLEADAGALRRLADEIEVVIDPALRAARSPGWECPHAEDIRGALRQQQKLAHSAAHELRVLAGQKSSAAADARAKPTPAP